MEEKALRFSSFVFLFYRLSQIILYVCVNELSDTADKRVQRHVSMWCVSVCVCTFMCWLLSEFLSFFFFLFFCRTHKGHDWMPCFCRAILQSHHSFLHVRFTLQTLLVTLPHPHQRLPPERLGGILAEIYSPHLYASETCWSEVISLPLSLFVFYVWSWPTL